MPKHQISSKSTILLTLLYLKGASTHPSGPICQPFTFNNIISGPANAQVKDDGYTLTMTKDDQTDARSPFDSLLTQEQCTFINFDTSAVADGVLPYGYRFSIKNFPSRGGTYGLPRVELVMGHQYIRLQIGQQTLDNVFFGPIDQLRFKNGIVYDLKFFLDISQGMAWIQQGEKLIGNKKFSHQYFKSGKTLIQQSLFTKGQSANSNSYQLVEYYRLNGFSEKTKEKLENLQNKNDELQSKLEECQSKQCPICSTEIGTGSEIVSGAITKQGSESNISKDESDELIIILYAVSGILGVLLLFTSSKLLYNFCLGFLKNQNPTKKNNNIKKEPIITNQETQTINVQQQVQASQAFYENSDDKLPIQKSIRDKQPSEKIKSDQEGKINKIPSYRSPSDINFQPQHESPESQSTCKVEEEEKKEESQSNNRLGAAYLKKPTLFGVSKKELEARKLEEKERTEEFNHINFGAHNGRPVTAYGQDPVKENQKLEKLKKNDDLLPIGGQFQYLIQKNNSISTNGYAEEVDELVEADPEMSTTQFQAAPQNIGSKYPMKLIQKVESNNNKLNTTARFLSDNEKEHQKY